MSQEESQQPNEPPYYDDIVCFDRNITGALEYLEKVEPHWILDPGDLMVFQPPNQEILTHNLAYMLGSQERGRVLVDYLDKNLNFIRSFSKMTAKGSSTLFIKAGVNNDSVDRVTLSMREFAKHRRDSSPTLEYFEDPADSNIMLTGLLTLTGAEIIREDAYRVPGTGRKIYKGILEGNAAYFVETIRQKAIEEDHKPRLIFEREVRVETEASVRSDLGDLSRDDMNILRLAGITLHVIENIGEKHTEIPDRQRMAEVIRLYESFQAAA